MSMSRGVWVIRDNELIPKHLAPPLNRKFAEGPMVIGDCMDRTLNPADGRQYDSKRAYYKAVRAAGCEIIGNEAGTASSRPQMHDPVDEIKAAIEQIESRAPKPRKRRKRGL